MIKMSERRPTPGALLVKRKNKAVWVGFYSGPEEDSSFDEWCEVPTGEHVRVIGLLLDVATAAYYLCDNTGDDGENRTVDRDSFAALSAALDKLAELPDDNPGLIMGEPAKAAWALKGLL